MASTDRCGVQPEDLVTFGDIRRRLGVSKQRAAVIVADRRFPPPWFVSADRSVRLWLREQVEAWLDEHRPGWRKGWV